MEEPKARVIITTPHDPLGAEMKDVLITEGYAAAQTTSAAGALETAEAFQPDAIVYDVRTADMSAPDFIEQIKGLLPDIAVIAMSGRGDTYQLYAVMLHPDVLDYFRVPIEVETFLVSVESSLRRARRR